MRCNARVALRHAPKGLRFDMKEGRQLRRCLLRFCQWPVARQIGLVCTHPINDYGRRYQLAAASIPIAGAGSDAARAHLWALRWPEMDTGPTWQRICREASAGGFSVRFIEASRGARRSMIRKPFDILVCPANELEKLSATHPASETRRRGGMIMSSNAVLENVSRYRAIASLYRQTRGIPPAPKPLSSRRG